MMKYSMRFIHLFSQKKMKIGIKNEKETEERKKQKREFQIGYDFTLNEVREFVRMRDCLSYVK